MTDTEAIALYVAAGNPEVLWHAIDEQARLYWRRMALKPMKVCIRCKEEYEPMWKGGILLHICPSCRGR